MNKAETVKKALNDVYVMRPLAILLLVVWHSFIIYTGGWKEPVAFQPIEEYWWLAKFSYSFMLELFVFISGYVLGLALERKQTTIKSLIVSKIKRLIIPSIIFSTIYYFCFYNLENFTIVGFLWNILNGCGHMWFLPMLFWVTLMAFILDNIKLPQWLKLIGVYFLPILSLLPIPLGISSAMYYLPFFYTGILIYRNRESKVREHCNPLICSVLMIVFAFVFIFATLISRDVLSIYIDGDLLMLKGIALVCRKYLQLICAISGIALVYCLVNYLIEVRNVTIPRWLVNINATCFGVYLFQQFILQFLYYKTTLPSLVGAYWLPWVGFVLTLILSYLLTELSLKTKIGRQLM